MSQLQYLIGSGLVILGLGGLSLQVEDAINGEWENAFLGLMLAVSCLTLGTFSLMAASSRYNGGWPSAIGLCLGALGLLFLGVSMDEYRAGAPQIHTQIGVVLGLGLLAAGAVFFHAGHRGHVRAQRERQSQDNAWVPQAREDWRTNVR